jgi:hypothetical protein
VEELPALRHFVKIVPALPSLHEDLLRKEEAFDPNSELGLVAEDLDEVPLGGLAPLLDAFEQLEGYGVGGPAGATLVAPSLRVPSGAR